MNFKKIIIFSLTLWLSITVIFYLLSFLPFLNKDIYFFTSVWILILIKMFFLCKWYFRNEEASTKNGIILGLSSSVIIFVLGYYISLPVLQKITEISFYQNKFYLLVIILEIFLFCFYAGFEFDRTFTKK
ncbi:MAG: hypothetical protein WC414_00300 [Patescibacteria group bacterium]